MKLSLMWMKKLWKASKRDSTLELKSVTLLDLNEDCLRHIGYHLSTNDTYSLGHTCTQLFGTVSKILANFEINNPNDLKYLNYFAEGTRNLTIDTTGSQQEFTENVQKNLLTIVEKCTLISSFKLSTSDSIILRSTFFRRSIRNLVDLEISLNEHFMKLPISCVQEFVELMHNCENLRFLTIHYDDVGCLDTVKKLLAIKFPKLIRFSLITSYSDIEVDIYDKSFYFVPLNTFLRQNSQLEFLLIYPPFFDEYFEAILLCQKLKEIDLCFYPVYDEELTLKLLILNKLPLLEDTSLYFFDDVNDETARILPQISSLKNLHMWWEDSTHDIFQMPQIKSLEHRIFIYVNFDTISETINELRCHERDLCNLTELTLLSDDDDSWITNNCLNEFIKFIINCPRIKSIKLPLMFPFHRFYKKLLKYEKHFGYGVREDTLRLKVKYVSWIPGYSNGKQTHDIIIQSTDGDKASASISNIIKYFIFMACYETPFVWLFLFFVLIGQLIDVIQNEIFFLIK